MPLSYEDALAKLHQAKLEDFVSQRKQLAAELKQGGDAEAAKRLAQRSRPSISAWAVNQLWWHAQAQFERMFETAAPLRAGKLASSEHRDALAKLRTKAASILEQGGHAASDATLRRVSTTLSALAAVGGFDPDLPGALAADRDPPGFEAIGILAAADDEALSPAQRKRADSETEVHAEKRKSAAAERESAEQARREKEAQRMREERRKKLEAEHKKLEAELRTAREKLKHAERELEQRQKELARAEEQVESLRESVVTAEKRLAEHEIE